MVRKALTVLLDGSIFFVYERKVWNKKKQPITVSTHAILRVRANQSYLNGWIMEVANVFTIKFVSLWIVFNVSALVFMF